MLDSRVICNQQLNERMKQRFAPFSAMVHQQEATEGERELLLCNAPMGAKPTPHQRPDALHRLPMDCTQVVSICLSGVRAPSMVPTLLIVSPCTQAGIHAVRIRIHTRTRGHGLLDERLHGLLLPMSTQVDAPVTAPLHHAKDRRLLVRQCAASTLAFASVSTSFAPLVLHHLRVPFLAGNHLGFVALHLVGPLNPSRRQARDPTNVRVHVL
jgi:hypothetical protein